MSDANAIHSVDLGYRTGRNGENLRKKNGSDSVRKLTRSEITAKPSRTERSPRLGVGHFQVPTLTHGS